MRRIRTFKVLMVGDGGVGKTTLLDAYRTGEFREHEITIGLNLATCKVQLEDGRKFKFCIFDMSGQTRFVRMILQISNLVKGANGALLVFDLSALPTLHALDPWVKEIRDANGDIPLVLVGAKADLEKEVTDEDIKHFMNKHNISVYVETSSKLLLNVDKPFKILAQKIDEALRGSA